MRRTARRLADGREIIYFDHDQCAPPRVAADRRTLAPTRARSEVRRDPLSGEAVVIAPHRLDRTLLPPAEDCPLCPSTADRATEIPERDYDVVVFENRFPAFTGPGRSEVVCFTADHTASFATLSPARARLVVDVWAERTAELGGTVGVGYVYPFENRGAEIGVTLHHPHGQIYAYPFVPPRIERELVFAARRLAATGRHPVVDVLADSARVVRRGERWTALVPAAARWPVQVQLVPHRQVPDLAALDGAERDELAVLYLDVLGRLDRIHGMPMPYVAGWHQAPATGGRDLAWLRLEVFSVRRAPDKLTHLAGTESGMAVWVNDRLPEQVAELLRRTGPPPERISGNS